MGNIGSSKSRTNGGVSDTNDSDPHTADTGSVEGRMIKEVLNSMSDAVGDEFAKMEVVGLALKATERISAETVENIFGEILHKTADKTKYKLPSSNPGGILLTNTFRKLVDRLAKKRGDRVSDEMADRTAAAALKEATSELYEEMAVGKAVYEPEAGAADSNAAA